MAARFEESSVSRQKDQPCRSGRKANINPELISYRQFLNAIGSNNGLGGLGCGDEFPYVTYEVHTLHMKMENIVVQRTE